MPTDIHTRHKALVQPVREALYDYESGTVQAVPLKAFDRDAAVRLAHSLEDLDGPEGLYESALATSDLERRLIR